MRLDATDVRLGNPAGFPKGDALVIKLLRLGIAVPPLFRRKIDVTSVAARGVVRVAAAGLDAMIHGSLGFDRTLNLAGIAVLNGVPPPAPPRPFLRGISGMYRNAPSDSNGVSSVRVPFVIRGTANDPKFSLAGTPTFVHGHHSTVR